MVRIRADFLATFQVQPNRKSVYAKKKGLKILIPLDKKNLRAYLAVVNKVTDATTEALAVRKVIPFESIRVERWVRHATDLQRRTDVQVFIEWWDDTFDFASGSVEHGGCSVLRFVDGGVTTEIQHHPDVLFE